MSVLNNENTLVHYLRDIWLTRAIDFSGGEKFQHINVCIRNENGEFTAVDFLRLEPDGTYCKNAKRLGKLDSPKLQEYIDSIVSVSADYVVDEEDEALFCKAAELYSSGMGIKAVGKEVGLSSQKVRRILVTRGVLETEASRKIKELHAAGKSIKEIQTELGVSAAMVRSYLPYKITK